MFDNVPTAGWTCGQSERNGRQFQHDNKDATMAILSSSAAGQHTPTRHSHTLTHTHTHHRTHPQLRNSVLVDIHRSPRSLVPCTTRRAVGSTPAIHSCGWTCCHCTGTPALLRGCRCSSLSCCHPSSCLQLLSPRCCVCPSLESGRGRRFYFFSSMFIFYNIFYSLILQIMNSFTQTQQEMTQLRDSSL